MMWKDFFYYSKGERRAVYMLLVLIALLAISIVWKSRNPDSGKSGIAETDSLEWRKFVAGRQDMQQGNLISSDAVHEPVLASFDPNLADSIELSALGLPRFVVRNVLKYRQKGGKFATPESFARIYGLTETKFLELKPYIRISEAFLPKAKKRKDTYRSTLRKDSLRDRLKRPFKYPAGTMVDVNSADTSELKKIPGIGSVIAGKIVAYRNRLGGFYSLEQLLEVKFVTPELLQWFRLEEGAELRCLHINKLGLEKLRSHPYLNFYQAKVIVEHRRRRGYVKSLSQLALYEEFTEKDLKRLSPYVSFD